MPETEISMLLRDWSGGNRAAADRLLPLVYKELHDLARGYMRRERPGHTLQPTALINQAYLQIAQSSDVDFQNRQHFVGIAANVMRRILVDHARERHAGKRGGKQVQVELEDMLAVSGEPTVEILMLEDALTRLEKLNPRQAKVVEMRYFVGLSVDEIAVALELSPRSVKRDWMLARIWLFDDMEKKPLNTCK